MRFWRGFNPKHWILFGALLPMALRGAEPVSDPGELPRLAPVEANEALGTLRVRTGFRLELAASEPEVADPVAMSFDEAGRLYVVEMRGYSERREANLGRVRLLQDPDGDGRFETSTVFADGLTWPTAVACWDGGVFVGVTPDILYLKDEDGDGVADVKRVVFTGFASEVNRLNVQALLNSFHWGLDNRIHGVASFSGGNVRRADVDGAKPVALRGRDFSFDPRTLELRAESGGGQHGMSFDDAGRKYVCSNSRHLQLVMYEDRYAVRNPQAVMPPPLLDIAADGAAAEVFRISPDEPWRIVRTRWRVAGLVDGPVEGGGRVSGYFTAATGVTIYRGDAFPASWVGDAFIGDAGSNLIHHKKLRPDGVAMVGERPADEAGVEFAASTDNWFRPVQFSNGPDGCLYVADMYREIIEHPWSLPETIKRHLDLNNGFDRGRIYRIVPEGFSRPGPRRLDGADTEALVAALEHPNGWHRDTAARLLYARRDARAATVLRRMARRSERVEGRVHALYALDGLDRLEMDAVRGALSDPDPVVRRHAVRLAEWILTRREAITRRLWDDVLRLTGDEDAGVRYQLAFTLGAFEKPARIDALLALALRDYRSSWMQSAVLCSLGDPNQGGAFRLYEALLGEDSIGVDPLGREFLGRICRLIGAQNRSRDVERVLAQMGDARDMESTGLILRELNAGLSQAGGSLESFRNGDELRALASRASAQALDPEGKDPGRLAAIRVLGLVLPSGQEEVFASLLDAGQPEFIRLDVLRELLRSQGARGVALVLERMKGFSPRLRREAVALMLRAPGATLQLLDAIESGEGNTLWVDPDQLGPLRGHRDGTVRDRVARLYGPGSTPIQNTDEALKALQLSGNPAKGETIYLERCASCHRAGERGHALGPDLETVKTSGREKILVNILEPNREVAPNYVNYDIAIQGGEPISGILAGETANGLTVRQANGTETVLLRSNVAGMSSTGQSMMPQGLAEGLGPQGLADLIEFIARLGER